MKKLFGFILAILLVVSFGMAQSPPQIVSIPITCEYEAGIFLSIDPCVGLTWAPIPIPQNPAEELEYVPANELLNVYFAYRLGTAHRAKLTVEFSNVMQDGIYPVNADGVFWTTWTGDFVFDGAAIIGIQDIYQSDWMTGMNTVTCEVKARKALHPAGLYTGDFIVTVEDIYIGT